MDVEDALQRLDHDEDLFREIVQIYVEDAPALLRTIHDAVDHADASGLQRAAHSLKGMTATLSAQQAVAAAYHLEQMGASGNLNEASTAVEAIDQRIGELDGAVRSYLKRS
jgi:HPt (histidine-containing phosphotransfer) domain-containing protein